MSPSDIQTDWRDPQYVSTVVGVLAVGALVAYAATPQSALAVDDVLLVLLAVTLPATGAYELARRLR